MRTDLLVKFAVAGVVVLMGCEQPAAVNPNEIVGSWTEPSQHLSPSGALERRLTFTPDGKFTSDSRMYGVYGGQPQKELSAYSVTEGRYAADGDRLILTPQRLTTWDRFYGASSKERVDDPYPYSKFLDDTHYEINGSTLTLKYITYPADAPVPTTVALKRSE